RQQRTKRMSKCGTLKAGVNLLINDGAADGVAPFEDQRRKAGFREIVGGHESVVSSADDHDTIQRRGHQSVPRFQSPRIMLAAFSPGAPMMPPPGWVAEPHI